MTVGERGGTTRTLAEGQALIEQHKASLAQTVRDDIRAYLSEYGEWHRDNLRVRVPADSKNVMPAVVGGMVCSGEIEETGERRRSSNPDSHGRKSNVYRFKTGTGSSTPPVAAASSGRCPERAGPVPGSGVSRGEIEEFPPEPARLFELPAEPANPYEAEAA